MPGLLKPVEEGIANDLTKKLKELSIEKEFQNEEESKVTGKPDSTTHECTGGHASCTSEHGVDEAQLRFDDSLIKTHEQE